MPEGIVGIIVILILFLSAMGALLFLYVKERKKTEDLDATLRRTQAENRALNNELGTRINADANARLAHVIVQDTRAGIMALDGSGNVVLLNPAAERITGYFPQDLEGKHFQHALAFTNEKDEPNLGPIQQALIGHPTQFSRWTFLSTRKGKIPITGTATPLSGPTGVIGAVVTIEDGSEEYAREEEEKAFFSAAAHELRSPLTSIGAVIEYLAHDFDAIPKEKARELLTDTNTYVVRLMGLVNDFLNLSRIEQHRLDIKKESFDIVKLTDEVIASLQMQVKERKLSINHPLTELAIPPVYADRSKTQEILTNLITNAIKYTHEGGITITHFRENSHVATLVADTGVGIDPQYHRMLFKKFSQVGAARGLSHTKSTGLGLYITKKIAELMGGDCVLESSEPGKGSTFKFWLPNAPLAVAID